MTSPIEQFFEQAAAGLDREDRTRFPMPAVGRPAQLAAVPNLLAGAAEVDLTPPPGMPKSGHSRNSQDGVGFRTRIRARVLYLRAGRAAVALIASDLHAGSAVVHRLVAAEVTATTDVPLAGLFMGATHTHAGPGQYHGSDFYNRWASNRPGLDPAWTAYLAERITAAVRTAYETRVPARLAAGSTEVWGYTRNRSLIAHVDNRSVADKRTERQRIYAAINPWLHLIRVDREEGGPLAALALFSIHGTGISRHDPAYNADVWAYIAGEMAQGIEARTGVRPITGAVEGTHGDVTPAVRPGLLVYAEAERVGRGIGAAAADLHDRLESRLSSQVRLATGYREIDLAGHPVIGGVRLADPAVGTAKLAGAVENSTPVLDRIPPFRPGFPKPSLLARSRQGRKWVFGGQRLHNRFAPLSAYPHILPVQFMLIGPMALLALPFEITVEAGRRLENDLTTVLADRGAAVDGVAVSSAANDYWDYLTTPEEYDRQCYEGASNLYGPNTLGFVSAAAGRLAADVAAGDVIDQSMGREFAGHVRGYLTPTGLPGSGPRRRPDGGGARFFDAERWNDAYWEFGWSGGAPGSLHWDQPLVRVERLTPGGWVAATEETGPVDDAGYHLGVFHLGAVEGDDGRHAYAARWYQPPLGAPGQWRFVLVANHGHPELAGDPFD
ncbi:MAG TPA: neutral/alkaline non-lysosomal ceramidase N-terminal domain-containing protein [Acidimicrobiales bacterium]|nr:neutral/alkaline non-lysosomal ceramidase N-terminal domain-containing protein [Acidimicrobiales bacterium]